MSLDGTTPAILTEKNRHNKCFFDSVTKTDSCWNWTAATCGKLGYGRFMLNRILHKTHRFSYQAYHGEIPDGMHVLHKCDNAKCVNPEHLFLGTHRDNMLDAISKGRTKIGLKGYFSGAYTGRKGALNGRAKLVIADIDNIKNSSKSSSELAEIYSVSRQTIWSIRKGKTWH